MLLSHITVMFLQDHDTPLHDAAREGYTDVVQLLIDKGADINAKDSVSYRMM